jgi:carbonic anhydrase
MIIRTILPAALLAFACLGAHAADVPGGPAKPEPYTPGKILTRNVQAGITPDSAIDILKQGNARFASGTPLPRDTRAHVNQTALGQYPFASFVACIDSRSTPEQVFDLGVGDAFSTRVAGNTVNEDILGSLEYGAKVAGSRLIVVLGHTNCGAIKGACDDVKLGNLSALLEKFKPAVAAARTEGERSSKNHKFVHDVTELNVKQTVEAIRTRSPILKEMEDQGKIKIVGALYDTSSGKVLWY